MPSLLPDAPAINNRGFSQFLASPAGVPLKTALWQAPLVAVLANEIGWFLGGFWIASLAVSLITQRWQNWLVQLVMIALLIGGAVSLVPVRSADFFILILIALLPMTWRLDSEQDHRALSPAGLTPTIFLVGAVFIYQIQFVVLLLLVIWLLSFLLWYCMALTGFRLETISLRWLPVLGVSTIIAAVIVALFTLVPRIDTGFIPGFADAKQQIALVDEVTPGGMSDLLADTQIAFKAVPDVADDNRPRYWRVFVLNEEAGGKWRRSLSRSNQVSANVAAHPSVHKYTILADTHDMSVLPIPGWPAGWQSEIRYSRWGEAIAGRLANPRRARVAGADNAPDLNDADQDKRQNKLLSGANPALVQWAKSTRPQFSNDADFIAMVMRRFSDEFSYDTKVSLPVTNALDRFFFDGKSGYCSYFATAMATILRAAGIEANVVVGYLGGEWNPYGGFWTIGNADAHAWVEARPDSGNWQRIDPTLGVMSNANIQQFELNAGALQMRNEGVQAGNLSFWQRLGMASDWAEALNTRLTLAIMEYGQDDANSDGPKADYTALIILVLSLGLTSVIVLGMIVLWTKRKSRIRRLEIRFEKTLAPFLGGHMRANGETLISLAHRASRNVGERLDQPDEAIAIIDKLAKSLTEWRFSPHTKLSVDDVSAMIKQTNKVLARHSQT